MDKQLLLAEANNELIVQGNMDAIEIFFASDYQAHANDKTYHGHTFIREFTGKVRNAISDISITNLQVLLSTDKTITWQRTLQGIHSSYLMGIPPSNRKVRWHDMIVTRFENGKIAEEWVVSDLPGELFVNLQG